MYVTSGLGVEKFNSSGTLLTGWEVRGSDPPCNGLPRGIALDRNGNVYVTNGCEVHTFSSDGEILEKWGSLGSEPGQCRDNGGIAVDRKGNVYVADTESHQVQVFKVQLP